MLPGMKQRIEVPSDPLTGQTMVLPAPDRFGDHGIIGNVDPLVVDADAVMAVFQFPIRIRTSKTVSVRTTQSLAGPEAVKPWLEWGLRIAAVVAGLDRPNE